MAIARLLRVTLEAPRPEVGVMLGRLLEFSEFHPARKDGMVQDIGLLLLESRAQEIYSRAVDLLDRSGIRTAEGERREVEKFQAHSIEEFLDVLEGYLETIERNVALFTDQRDRWGATEVLLAIEEASLMVFHDLQRILVYPTEHATVRIEGFVPASMSERLSGSLRGYVSSAEQIQPKQEDVAYIPTLLVNPRLVSVFESLTLMRGVPRYGEVDPTPVLAFVFPLFFGVMFADVGHSLALLAFGLFLVLKTSYKVWGRMVVTLSLSTAVFGFVRGSAFGVAFPSPVEGIVHLPPEVRAGFTLSSIPFLLEVALGLGAFHLASGYAIAFVNEERAGNYLEALLDRLPTVVLYVFLVPFAFAVAGAGLDVRAAFSSSAPTPVLDDLLGLEVPVSETARTCLPPIAGAMLALLLGEPAREYATSRSLWRAVKALGSGVVEAVAKPFEFFMNTVSYVRLGVLLITTTLLGSLVADVMAAGPIGLLLAVLLNVGVISLEGVIVYVQDMRLHLYEWLSRFYAGTGTPFVPLVSRGLHFSLRWT